MALNARELKILYLTVAVAVGALLWNYGVRPIYENYQLLTARLAEERATFEKNRDILSRTRQIEQDYRQVEATFPQQDDRNPEDAFSEDVDAAAEEILPGKRRVVEPVKSEEIKGVEGYEFLTLTLGVTGDLESISRLLKGFDQKGFLIKSLSLTHSRGIDEPDLKLDVTLARVVKIEEQPAEGPGLRRPSARPRTRPAGRRP